MDRISVYSKRLREHVAKSERNPQAAQLSLAAIDSFEKVMISRQLLDGDLSKMLSAARSRHLGPYYIGTELLLTMLSEFPQITDIWRDLAISKLAHERWVAISVIRDDRIPFDLAKELIQRAINDKSAKVRLFAVEGVLVRNILSLIPDLEKRAKAENNRKVFQSLEWVLSKLK
jgi:hypothetical protein